MSVDLKKKPRQQTPYKAEVPRLCKTCDSVGVVLLLQLIELIGGDTKGYGGFMGRGWEIKEAVPRRGRCPGLLNFGQVFSPDSLGEASVG